MPLVPSIFDRLLADALEAEPQIEVDLQLGIESCFPNDRDFAMLTWNYGKRPAVLTYAPKLERCSPDRIEGVLRHEFGHLILFTNDLLDHAERQADSIAEALWGSPIWYDDEDVQTIRKPYRLASRFRPKYLPR